MSANDITSSVSSSPPSSPPLPSLPSNANTSKLNNMSSFSSSSTTPKNVINNNGFKSTVSKALPPPPPVSSMYTYSSSSTSSSSAANAIVTPTSTKQNPISLPFSSPTYFDSSASISVNPALSNPNLNASNLSGAGGSALDPELSAVECLYFIECYTFNNNNRYFTMLKRAYLIL